MQHGLSLCYASEAPPVADAEGNPMDSLMDDAYATGVLKPEIHSRLVANLSAYVQRANIQVPYVLDKMSKFGCNADEIAYVRTISRAADEGRFGLVYHGKETQPVMPRMMAVAGACLRNFRDAKVMTVQALLADLKTGEIPEARVLLVPNFFIERVEGGRLAEWLIADLLGMLYGRLSRGQQTFLYISNFDALRKTYGIPLAAHIQAHFQATAA